MHPITELIGDTVVFVNKFPLFIICAIKTTWSQVVVASVDRWYDTAIILGGSVVASVDRWYDTANKLGGSVVVSVHRWYDTANKLGGSVVVSVDRWCSYG